MSDKISVKAVPGDGPVSIIIKSGYASRGSYVISFGKEFGYKEIARGRIDDTFPDIIIIPLNEDELPGQKIYILGNYIPSPGNTQVLIEYEIMQKNILLSSKLIESDKEEMTYCNNIVEFE